MEHLMQFIGNHVLLCSGFLIALFSIFLFEAYLTGSSADRLTPQAVTQSMNRDNAVIVDLRDAAVFQAGHILGSINIPIADWDAQVKKLKKYETKPLILVDAMGQKVQSYKSKLVKLGFQNVKSLSGGISAWRTDNLPLIKK